MWQIHYFLASELAAERSREAGRERLVRSVPRGARPLLIDRVRRFGALIAAGIARRLDECVAREVLEHSASKDRVGVGG
jgi:hypothetical protein